VWYVHLNFSGEWLGLGWEGVEIRYWERTKQCILDVAWDADLWKDIC
jgi:hypothetical protein